MSARGARSTSRSGRQGAARKTEPQACVCGNASSVAAFRSREPRTVVAVCLFLALATFLVFGGTLTHDFINYDDSGYIYENSHVLKGLTFDGIAWAMSTGHMANWHPLTWLSHMLDCQIYSERPWGHHLTNVVFHAVNAVLLFLVLLRMTGGLWPSAVVAAVFAVHPQHVESVAWVAERKDVLSGFFWMLTMAAYARYAERPSSWRRYWTVALAFSLGLMAKPMLVTLPFVLLLLDYWPLGRLQVRSARESSQSPRFLASASPLVVEKIPLFVLAAASCVVTFLVQRHGGAVITLQVIPFPARLSNALVSYAVYVVRMLFPMRLAVFYPHPLAGLPVWEVAGSVLALLVISAAAIRNVRKRPYLLVGWLWYLGTLAPVIGIVQVGDQAMADRYTYLTTIGASVAIVWACAELLQRRPHWRRAFAAASGLCLIVLGFLAWVQTGYWRDSETLFRRALAVTSRNDLAHENLGGALYKQERIEEAGVQYLEALRINPMYVDANNNYGAILVRMGKVEEAMTHYSRALQVNPKNASAHNNLGVALEKLGRNDEALAQYSEAVRLRPDYADAHNNLGVALGKKGDLEGAVKHCAEAARIKPGFAEAHYNLGCALGMIGKSDEAAVHYSEALRLAPAHEGAHINLGAILEQQGKLDESIAHYEAVLKLDPNCAIAHLNIAGALQKKGNRDLALRHCADAARLAPADAEFHLELAGILARLNMPGEARREYEMAILEARTTSETAIVAKSEQGLRDLRQ